jgi:hypothetical protein
MAVTAMGLTNFYAIDQERLARTHWDLADTFADLHTLVGSRTPGIERITVADLRIVLDACVQCEELQNNRQRDAIARVRATIGLPARTLEPSPDMEV